MSIMNKLDAYLDDFGFVNQQEVEMAVCDFFQDKMGVEQLSMSDILEAGKIAEDYIKEKGLKFDPDLVITLDSKNKCIHLKDLNNEINENQIKRLEKAYNNAFLNACDCMCSGYGMCAWNSCGVEGADERLKIRAAAKDYMSNNF